MLKALEDLQYRLSLEHDPDLEDPLPDMGWKFVSFNRRHTHSADRDDYLLNVNAYGEATPANIGLRRKLDRGTAFWVSCYEHGGTAYSLKGEGMQCRWDSTTYAGILLWTGKAVALGKTYAERQEIARSAIETYSDWANGNCYAFDLATDDGDPLDSCGGFYDAESLFDAVREVLRSHDIDPATVEVEGDAKWLMDYHSLEEPAAKPNPEPLTPGEETFLRLGTTTTPDQRSVQL